MSLFKRLFGKKKEQTAELDIPVVEEVQVVPEEIQEEVAQTVGDTLDTNVKEDGEEIKEAFIEQEKTEDLEYRDEETQEEVQEVAQEEIKEELQEEVSVQEDDANLEEDARLIEEVQKENSADKMNLQEIEEIEKSSLVDEEDDSIESEEIDIEVQEEETPKKQGFIKRLFSGLSKTRDSILKGVDDVLSSFKHIDEDLYEELEEALIMADFGVDTTLHIMEQLKAKVKSDKISDPAELKPALQEIITKLLTDQPTEDILNPDGPTVVLVIGVNGVGKTTSIGKMSHLFKSQGKKVLVAAADTFRAAAIEQLNVWTDRAGVEIIKHTEGSDAAAVVFDAVAAAKSRKADVLICDTAGRLQNKTNLMKELEKISRIVGREYPEAKKEILIVIDATTGQNALQQVKLFKEVADISGIILTKLDGTAKGGAIVGIYESLKVPVKYIGVGEKIDDLQPFDAQAFARALFETEA